MRSGWGIPAFCGLGGRGESAAERTGVGCHGLAGLAGRRLDGRCRRFASSATAKQVNPRRQSLFPSLRRGSEAARPTGRDGFLCEDDRMGRYGLRTSNSGRWCSTLGVRSWPWTVLFVRCPFFLATVGTRAGRAGNRGRVDLRLYYTNDFLIVNRATCSRHLGPQQTPPPWSKAEESVGPKIHLIPHNGISWLLNSRPAPS